MALAENYTSLDEMLAKGDRLVRLRKGADILGKHPDTLKRWAEQSPPKIRLVKTSSRNYDIWLSEIENFVKSRAEPSEAERAVDVAAVERLRLVRKGEAA